jgi:uncharacterized coiled-coil protein SlyX
MSMEDRVTALEQGLSSVQQDFITHLSQNNRQMAALNRVLAEQEVHTRDLDHNLTILLGVASEQGRDIKVVKERLGGVDSRLDGIDQRLSNVEQGIQQILQQLTAIAAKLKE